MAASCTNQCSQQHWRHGHPTGMQELPPQGEALALQPRLDGWMGGAELSVSQGNKSLQGALALQLSTWLQWHQGKGISLPSLHAHGLEEIAPKSRALARPWAVGTALILPALPPPQICSLMRGGIAERGGIRVGHRIIEINGQSVVATPHEKIIQILTQAVSEVSCPGLGDSQGPHAVGQL